VIRLGRSGRRFERSTDSSKYLQYIARCGLSRRGRNGSGPGAAVSVHSAAKIAGALSCKPLCDRTWL
jgi:hypothetical protein